MTDDMDYDGFVFTIENGDGPFHYPRYPYPETMEEPIPEGHILMIDVDLVPDDVDWDTILGTLFEEECEYESILSGEISLEGATAILRLDDTFGWDHLLVLRDGRMLLEDRNSGTYVYTTDTVEDPIDFVGKFIKLIDGVDEGG